ncbi:MAG: tRNA (adenosine(37)-N6)-threonylcarbamoyltransferase complex ATPase subunit type 1 TsaE, partial [Planctomycetota bacterium]
GTVVVLRGPLGAGKTRFVKAFAAASNVPPDDVSSPTFVLCKHYAGSRPITHMDVYRIADVDEFASLDPDELFAADGVTFIEWGERVREALPPDHVEIAIELKAGTGRVFRITGPAWLGGLSHSDPE